MTEVPRLAPDKRELSSVRRKTCRNLGQLAPRYPAGPYLKVAAPPIAASGARDALLRSASIYRAVPCSFLPATDPPDRSCIYWLIPANSCSWHELI